MAERLGRGDRVVVLALGEMPKAAAPLAKATHEFVQGGASQRTHALYLHGRELLARNSSHAGELVNGHVGEKISDLFGQHDR